MKLSFLFCLVFLSGSLFGQSGYPQYYNDKIKDKKFSIETFNNNVERYLKDSAVGWAYQIWKGGKKVYSKHGGYAIAPYETAQGNGLPFTSATKMHIASLSKTITTMAVAHMLENKNYQWTDTVAKFFPSNWKVHPSLQGLDFKSLVEMKAGFANSLLGNDCYYDSLQKNIEAGIDPAKKGKYAYQNINYALLRVIAPYALGYQEAFRLSKKEQAMVNGLQTAAFFNDYVNRFLFRKAGIQNGTMAEDPNNPVMMYSFRNKGKPGISVGTGSLLNNGDFFETYGGFGWYMSIDDYAKFLNTVLFSKAILSKKSVDEMMHMSFPFNVEKGTYGDFILGTGYWSNRNEEGHFCSLNTVYLILPDDTVLVAFANSEISYRNNFPGWMINAYDKSFVAR